MAGVDARAKMSALLLRGVQQIRKRESLEILSRDLSGSSYHNYVLCYFFQMFFWSFSTYCVLASLLCCTKSLKAFTAPTYLLLHFNLGWTTFKVGGVGKGIWLIFMSVVTARGNLVHLEMVSQNRNEKSEVYFPVLPQCLRMNLE